MKRTLISLIISWVVLMVAADTVVECRPGQLASLVDDCGITALKVQGGIDARDFRFIADSLRHLEQLDLSEALIEAYSGKSLFAGQSEYEASVLPVASLACMRQLTQLSLPKQAVALDVGSLAGCTALEHLQMPEALVTIGDYALSGCSALKSVVLPQSLSQVSEGAFSGCKSLVSVQIAAAAGDEVNALQSSSVSIGYRAFADCPSLKTLSLGNRLSSIGGEALIETGLEQLDLRGQSQLDSIADWALAQSSLQTLELPESLRSIGEGAMMRDTAIERITLPASLRFIDSYAMSFMTGLQQITSKAEHAPALGDSVWFGVEQSAVRLDVSAASRQEYESTPQWQDFMFASYLHGDVDGNGVVDVIDINILINIMMGADSPDNYDGRAYVNDDEFIDVSDVNEVINVMLAKRLAARRARAAAREAAALHQAESGIGVVVEQQAAVN